MDDLGWEVAKIGITVISTASLTVAIQKLLPREMLVHALRADARGAMRTTNALIPQFRQAAQCASNVEACLTDSGGMPTFESVNALWEGWVISAPAADFLGHGQRFDDVEAEAVMKYLHHWNCLMEYERRYREAVNQFLRQLGTKDGLGEGGCRVAREYIRRARDDANECATAARLLRAQARAFHDGRIQALSEDEERQARLSEE